MTMLVIPLNRQEKNESSHCDSNFKLYDSFINYWWKGVEIPYKDEEKNAMDKALHL